MSIFGRSAARQRLRRAARGPLEAAPFRAPPIDCAPWVTGGLWPAELSAVTAQTAPLVQHLKADLQRIVDAANEQVEELRRTAGDRPMRRLEEERIINDARAFASQRVESTVRFLRDSRHGRRRALNEPHVNGSFIALN